MLPVVLGGFCLQSNPRAFSGGAKFSGFLADFEEGMIPHSESVSERNDSSPPNVEAASNEDIRQPPQRSLGPSELEPSPSEGTQSTFATTTILPKAWPLCSGRVVPLTRGRRAKMVFSSDSPRIRGPPGHHLP